VIADHHRLGSWQEIFADEVRQPYFSALSAFVQQEYMAHTCYPPQPRIYAAFDYCALEQLKVVIIGQDPYHGAGQANGLCFSVNDGITQPPSLLNIFKEIEADVGTPLPSSGNLERWARQGVLLLNATLTVRAGQAGSHQKKGWERFTDAVISRISQCKDHVVFLLWGAYAKKKGAKIDQSKHHLLTSSHPSPLSANRGGWFGNRHFSRANEYLSRHGMTPIDW